jgi:tryptophanyl-tRNA synthetase
MKKVETVLSGIRATGRLHFGNFLGAVQNFVKYQDIGHKCLYFIADLHTLTTLDDPEELRGNVIEVAKDYLAAGLDPNKSILYVQSSVPEIIELSLYLGMFQPLGELLAVPTYKELARKFPDRISHGLVTYPVLMAADILGPQSTLIPVGKDQIPNVELARSLASRFNNRFGETFEIPEMMDDMVRIPGLDGGKMGKSDSENAININDPIDEIREKYLKKGVTDPQKEKRGDPGDPYNGCRSVYAVHEVVTEGETETRQIANQCLAGSIGCKDCKLLLVEGIEKVITPFQERRRDLDSQDEYVRDVLHEGGKKARSLFCETIDRVREKIGITIY